MRETKDFMNLAIMILLISGIILLWQNDYVSAVKCMVTILVIKWRVFE